MNKVNQHYVPQFYLRNFSPNGKSTGMLIHGNGKCILDASIKKQASEKYLYGKDQRIEEFFSNLESETAPIIKKIIEEQRFSRNPEDNVSLLQFLLLLEARTLKIADSSSYTFDFIDKILNAPSNRNNSIPNLTSILAAAESMPIIADLTLALLTCDSDNEFITSDTPVCRYNLLYVLRNYAMRGYGLVNVGAQFYLPLSSKHCLYLFDPSAYFIDGDISKIGKADVDVLNKLFLLNSYQYAFFNQSNGCKYISELAAKTNHKNDIEDEIERFGNLIIRKSNKVTEEISPSFIKVNIDTYNMPFPAHMGGPVRPYAQDVMNRIESNRQKRND